jgi:hypothetical protein
MSDILATIQLVDNIAATVADSMPSIDVVLGSAQGPPGPNTTLVSGIASIALSGHRLVTVNGSGELIYADNTTASHATKVLGLTLGAASIGAATNVKTYGEVTEPSWTWTMDSPIYLGANGVLTQTAPATGFILIVGFPLSATTIFLDTQGPIILS